MYVSHNAGKKQEKRFLSQRADHEVSSLEEGGGGTLCLLFVSGYFLVIFLLCGFFPLGFSHRGFFHAGVWAHPAKLIMCLAPALCVRVCCWWKVHGCGWNVLRWKLYVLVAVCGLCGCGCLQVCTTTLNQFSVMGGGGEGGRRAVDNGWKGARIERTYKIVTMLVSPRTPTKMQN